MVDVAEEFANNPFARLPSQLEKWGDLKAPYRLFNFDSVTFKALGVDPTNCNVSHLGDWRYDGIKLCKIPRY